jgi:hypothetical protein
VPAPGKPAVISGCIALLQGHHDVDDVLVLALRPAALYVLDGHAGGKEGYWPRVWAARGKTATIGAARLHVPVARSLQYPA